MNPLIDKTQYKVQMKWGCPEKMFSGFPKLMGYNKV